MKMSGLELLPLGDIEAYMPVMACGYDCGPLPIINGRLWTDKWSDAFHHTVKVESLLNAETGITRWAIREGAMALTKGGIWTWERRRGNILNRIRYDTAKEAITHYFEWKAKTLKRAQRLLAKNPDAILNFR